MLRLYTLTAALLLAGCATAMADDNNDANGKSIPVSIAAFPQQGPTESLEPEVLDFRYQPSRWQTCIGLVDDPMKTLVGDDGGLYYEYGKQGPAPYNNGQGTFGARVLAGFVGTDSPGPLHQSLYSPRVPLVVTRQQVGRWDFVQEAWSAVAAGAVWNTTGAGRVDYLSLTARNGGADPATGQMTLSVGARSRLELDDTRTRLLMDGHRNRVFCQFSRPCNEPVEVAAGVDAAATSRVRAGAAISVQRNWAQPDSSSAACFRDVLVGFGQPLDFQIDVPAGAKVGVAVGLIEGWHAEPAKRPLHIEIEGRAERTVDLVREVGKNVPLVLPFSVVDEDRDGVVRVRVLPQAGAEDSNTIISGLWVFPADTMPAAEAIRQGQLGGRVLALLDATHPPDAPKPLQLTWDTGTMAEGKEFQLLVALPLSDTVGDHLDLSDAALLRKQGIDAWQQADLPYDRLVVPDPAVQGLLDSCIRNIYQAREWKEGLPKFQVGPTCYRGTWAADGPFLLEAVSYLGRTVEARAGLEQQVDGDDGPGGIEFSKKSGLRLWMIWRHYQLTGDRAWLRLMWPKVERDVNQIIEYRSMTRDDPRQANYGLMPIGFGDGGLGGKHREYTNIYWTLAGLHAAIGMAEVLQHPRLSDWREEYADYSQAFDRARQRDKLVDEAGNTYVPVTMQSEKPQLPQCGAWAFLQAIFPGRIFAADDALMLGTMAMLDANQREGLLYGTGWIPDGIWNYAASFYGHAHLWLGHGRKAAATLYAFGNHASPLLCWREEQNVVGDSPHFVGDMPHNWGSAEFIRLVRHLVILERGSELHLLPGLPGTWTRPGCLLEMKEVPTSFGVVSVKLEVSADGRSAKIVVDPPQRETVARMVVHLEGFGRSIDHVVMNGVEVQSSSAELPADAPTTFVVEFEP